MKYPKILIKAIFSNEIRIPLILLAVFIIFKEKWEIIFTDLIVKNFLIYVRSIWIVDLLFIICCIIYIFFLTSRIKLNYHVSIQNYAYLLVFGIIYSNYRILDSVWNVTGFSFWGKFAYADILYFFILGSTIQLLITYKKRKAETKNQGIGYFEDLPIGLKGKDLLGRETFAEEIARRINITRTERSLAIGINGIWGSGKTSFLFLIKRHLSIDNQIIIDFNPWNSRNTDTIVQDFFKVLENSLNEYSSQVTKEVNNYVESLIDKKHITWFDLLRRLKLLRDNSIKDYFDNINSIIRKLNKQIIIFIDDLDRLNKAEILETLKIIRNSANFFNTVFVAPYDKNYIINLIDGQDKLDKSLYLEKIFQVEYELPRFEISRIRIQLADSLKKVSHPRYHSDVDNLFNPRFQYLTKPVDYFLMTFRDVTRFVNSFSVILKQLDEEVSFPDLFCIELIRFRYPLLVQELFLKSDAYFAPSIFNSTYLALKYENGTPILKHYLSNNHSLFNIPINKVEDIISALEMIFGHQDRKILEESFVKNIYISAPNNPKSITIPSNFNRYFTIRLLDSDISVKDYSLFRELDLDKNKHKINEWIKNGLRSEIFNKLSDIKFFNSKGDFENIIRTIFYISNIPIDTSEIASAPYFNYMILYKMLRNAKEVSELFYNSNCNDYFHFLMSIFNDAKSPYDFESYFLCELNTAPVLLRFPLNKKQRVEIVLRYLEQYLKDTDYWDNRIYQLVMRCEYLSIVKRNKGSNEMETQLEIHHKARTLVKEFIRGKGLNSFIKHSIFQEDGRYSIDRSIFLLFEEMKDFSLFIGQLPETPVLTEYKAFIFQLESTKSKSNINFNFREIKL